MAYRLIRGEFHLFYRAKRRVGSQPDGDSVWFKPLKPGLLRDLAGRSAKFNRGGIAQLRFEAIDALELHFEGVHQEIRAATAAREFTLGQLGFQTVSYSGETQITVRDAAPHPRPGYILIRSIDPFGRPVSFVFTGSAQRRDGSDVYLTPAMLLRSVNVRLARGGYAFPTFYTGLPTDLRRVVVTHARSARQARRGIWAKDVSLEGASIGNLSQLGRLVVWPKLFRRLVSYFHDGNRGLGGFNTWLRADEDRDDRLWIASRAELAHLHDVVRISGNRLAMTVAPDDLIIVPR